MGGHGLTRVEVKAVQTKGRRATNTKFERLHHWLFLLDSLCTKIKVPAGIYMNTQNYASFWNPDSDPDSNPDPKLDTSFHTVCTVLSHSYREEKIEIFIIENIINIEL